MTPGLNDLNARMKSTAPPTLTQRAKSVITIATSPAISTPWSSDNG